MIEGKKVAVLLGGKSSEREVSLTTGREIAKALVEKGHQVKEIDPAEANFTEQLQIFQPDIVFIALHGKFGEDGTIQGLLELLGYSYIGSGVLASALAMNKIFTKKILNFEGINTPPFKIITNKELQAEKPDKIIDEVVAAVGLPLVVKPACQGSTIGISIVRDQNSFLNALTQALNYDNQILIEKFIEGIELTAPVLGTNSPRVLPLIEIVAETGFYDYKAKYSPGMSRHIIPARISSETTQNVEELALRAYRALNCRHLARIDFIISNENIPYVLEVNTIPGMTPVSLFPDAARAAGISFPDLINCLVEEALSSTE